MEVYVLNVVPPLQRPVQSCDHTVGLPAVVKTRSVGYWPRLAAAELFVGSLPPGNREQHENLNRKPLTGVWIRRGAAAV